jgi:hypothetical protein
VDGEALRGLAGADCGSECRSPGSAAGFRDPASQQQLHRHPPRRSGHQGERLVDCIDCKSGACLIFPCPVHMARHAFQMLYAKFDCVCNFKAPGRGGGRGKLTSGMRQERRWRSPALGAVPCTHSEVIRRLTYGGMYRNWKSRIGC